MCSKSEMTRLNAIVKNGLRRQALYHAPRHKKQLAYKGHLEPRIKYYKTAKCNPYFWGVQ